MSKASRFHLRIVLLLILAVVPLAAHAETAAPSSTYVSTETLPPLLLPPPPEEGSAAWKQEIARVLAAQEEIPATDRKAMRDEQHVHIELMTSVIGDNFTREHFPKTFAVLDRVLGDTRLITDADKKFWHTRRPYIADHRVKLLVDRIDKSFAYPSGHTSSSHVIAEVLGLLYPEKIAELRARADAIARRRVEAGVHYPVDIRAGETLAAMIVGALMDNDYFQDDLALAREEIAEEAKVQPQ